METFYSILSSEAAVLFVSSFTSILLLSRVIAGPRHDSSSLRSLQGCDSFYHFLPSEQLLLSSVAVVVTQTFIKRCSYNALKISWAIQIIITNLCLSLVKADLQHKISVNIPLFCVIFLSHNLAKQTACQAVEDKTTLNADHNATASETEKLLRIEVTLANEKLEGYKRELNAKKSMVRHISHEIRTPLNTVSIGIEVLVHELASLGDGIAKSSLDIADGIKSACGIALFIVNEFLAFERLSAGLAVVELAPILVVPWILEIMKEFFIPALTKRITIELLPSIFPPDDTAVCIDPVKMAYVLRNFLSNAVKFTPKGGEVKVILYESLSRVDKSSCITISVEDSGAGLSAENVSKLFQEGVQFNANVLQNGGGSGFGLFIAKGISHLHTGCSIFASSPGEGKGCTFSIEIPLLSMITPATLCTALVKEGSGNRSPSVSSNVEESPQITGPLSILIVDDSLPSRKMVGQLLGLAGHSCTLVDDGLSAVSEISLMIMKKKGNQTYKQYDAVLMDSRMPKMNGPEATETIRKLGFEGAIIGIR